MNYELRIMRKSIFLVGLFFLAFLERTVFDFGPNVELVTAALIFSSYYFGRKASFWLTLSILVLSDLVIGNTSIFLFTWSGFLIPPLFSKNLINRLTKLTSQLLNKHALLNKATSLTVSGVISNLFFFFWTNFGVWLFDSWGMYTRDLSGLIKCFTNALPFLRNQITGNVIFIPLTFLAIEISKRLFKKLLKSNSFAESRL